MSTTFPKTCVWKDFGRIYPDAWDKFGQSG